MKVNHIYLMFFFFFNLIYSKVDTNHDYDDLEMLENDHQDNYFDSETPEILSKGDVSSDSAISFDPPRSLTQKMEDLGK